MKNNHFGKLKKSGDKLIYTNTHQSVEFDEFRKNLPEGALVEIFMEEVHEDGNLAQLAKAHALVRSLSNHTGFDFEDMKTLIKEKAGLCLVRSITGKEYFLCKSLGDASKEELSAFIQAAITLGEEVNFPLK